jgi:hypothetical protein
MSTQTLSIVKKLTMGKSILNWTDEERKIGDKKLKQKAQILIREYNEKKQLFSKRTYFERLPFELNLKIMGYLDINDHKSLSQSKIPIMKDIFSSNFIYNMSNIDKVIKLNYFADRLQLNYEKLTELRFKQIKSVFKFVDDDDWFIELPDLNKLLYFLGCDGKRYLKYNQSPISINYKKRVCRDISNDVCNTFDTRFPYWRCCRRWGLVYRAQPDDFTVTDFNKEKDFTLDDWYYEYCIVPIEYELKNVGHFNYWEYFHKYPTYHPEHPIHNNNDNNHDNEYRNPETFWHNDNQIQIQYEEPAYEYDYEEDYWNAQYEDDIAD